VDFGLQRNGQIMNVIENHYLNIFENPPSLRLKPNFILPYKDPSPYNVKTTHKVGLYPEGKGAGPGGGAVAQKTDFLRGHTLPNFLSLSWKIGISQCLGFFESGGYLKTRFPVL